MYKILLITTRSHSVCPVEFRWAKSNSAPALVFDWSMKLLNQTINLIANNFFLFHHGPTQWSRPIARTNDIHYHSTPFLRLAFLAQRMEPLIVCSNELVFGYWPDAENFLLYPSKSYRPSIISDNGYLSHLPKNQSFLTWSSRVPKDAPWKFHCPKTQVRNETTSSTRELHFILWTCNACENQLARLSCAT